MLRYFSTRGFRPIVEKLHPHATTFSCSAKSRPPLEHGGRYRAKVHPEEVEVTSSPLRLPSWKMCQTTDSSSMAARGEVWSSCCKGRVQHSVVRFPTSSNDGETSSIAAVPEMAVTVAPQAANQASASRSLPGTGYPFVH